MKRRIIKILVPVLVLAMLLQIPFAMSASASTLSEGTSYKFVISKAEDTAAGNTQVKLYATTDENELVTTVGATLVIDTAAFDIVNKAGEVVTDTYKVNNTQLGDNFPLTASAVDEGESFDFMPQCSIASYNATTGEMYIFISGLSALGLSVAENSEIATFYLQAKEGVTPSIENMRLMMLSEYKDTAACPSNAVAPGEISSKTTVFKPVAEDIVTNLELEFDLPTLGTVSGSVSSLNGRAEYTVVLKNDDNEFTKTVSGLSATYAFEEVPAGTYTIEVSAPGSLGFTVTDIAVEASQETEIPDVTVLFGDCDGSGTIAASDIPILLSAYGSSTIECDVDGSGTVAASDITIILRNDHYGISKASQTLSMA